MQDKMHERVQAHVTRIGPHIGGPKYDYTDGVRFPEGVSNVCAVRRFAENGSSYGFDTIYILWLKNNGELGCHEVTNTKPTQGYLAIKAVRISGETVELDLIGTNDEFHKIPLKGLEDFVGINQ